MQKKIGLRGNTNGAMKNPTSPLFSHPKEILKKINWAPSTLPFGFITRICNNPSPCQIGSQRQREIA